MEFMYEYLGSKCVRCGSIANLEIDHIDPKQKEFNPGKKWGTKLEVLIKELDKCQLLCEDCHKLKSVTDMGNQHAKGFHGTLSTFRYCKCKECRKAYTGYQREYMREYRKRKRGG